MKLPPDATEQAELITCGVIASAVTKGWLPVTLAVSIIEGLKS